MSSDLLLLIPALPAMMALVLGIIGHRLPYNLMSGAATFAVFSAFALVLGFTTQGIFGQGAPVVFDLGPWIMTQGFQAALALRLDSTALCMALLISGFGSLITLYSIGYMRHDQEQHRFFASLNLFVAAMLTLVLADNLVLIFLGWEGVGLCSYLLIGHYWEQEGVPLAAFRAFFVNRIGDVLFLLGVFTLFSTFGTISLEQLKNHGPDIAVAYPWATRLAAFFLLGGAFAKSAQAPLHVWLPDAMAGPTPVSALIHAATMVTAGIYLVMRLDWLYAIVPEARLVIALCATVTLVVGATLACSQTDLKKILAYSTLSNLAMMFLALSAGVSGAAMLHLFGHAFFKALLFLAAGSVIFAAHHEQEVGKLLGVLKKLPITNLAFIIGCIGGAGLLPYVAAGFFTKESVLMALEEAHFQGFGFSFSGQSLYWVVVAVESLSAVYLARLFGYLRSDVAEEVAHQAKHGHHHEEEVQEKSWTIRIVLVVLAIAAPLFGLLSAPHSFGGKGFLYSALMAGAEQPKSISPSPVHVLPFLIFNLVLASFVFMTYSNSRRRQAFQATLGRFKLGHFGPLTHKWWFDEINDVVVVAPLKGVSWLFRLLFETVFKGILSLAGYCAEALAWILRRFQTGKTHQYALAVLVFAVLFGLILFRK